MGYQRTKLKYIDKKEIEVIKMERKPKISFDNTSKEFILDIFNKYVKDNEILEKDTAENVKSFEGNILTINDFGGVKKGSEIFIEDNVVSLMRLRNMEK
jgi:hypothetical protein